QGGVGRGRAYGNTVPLVVRCPCDTSKIADRDCGVDQVDCASLCAPYHGIAGSCRCTCVEQDDCASRCALYHGIAGRGYSGGVDTGSRCNSVAGYCEVACGITDVACKVRFLDVELIGGAVGHSGSVAPVGSRYCSRSDFSASVVDLNS
ncbi:MAG: hypothetical protein P8L36_18270, partial [SAR324 cluster bacterium]|nr:hypothetical protein [SAR324 cluster bacterium]